MVSLEFSNDLILSAAL